VDLGLGNPRETAPCRFQFYPLDVTVAAVIQELGCLAVIHPQAHELLARVVAAATNRLSGFAG
jgi:hypothetical protein